MTFGEAEPFKRRKGKPTNEEFFTLWAPCPEGKSFVLDGKTHVLSTVQGQANRYRKQLGCVFQVNQLENGDIKVSKYSKDVLVKKYNEEIAAIQNAEKKISHEEIREHNIDKQRERVLQANNWSGEVEHIESNDEHDRWEWLREKEKLVF